ncbi:MAG: M48 family metalloprotease [Terriglobia bacterium]
MSFSPLLSWLSRRHEYQADRYAAMAIADSEPMIQSLVKLTKDNLSNLTPHPLYSFFTILIPPPWRESPPWRSWKSPEPEKCVCLEL